MSKNPRYVMYTGEAHGHLSLGHIECTARDVRHSIASMFTRTDLDANWKLARKEGWKVVRILVHKDIPGE